MSQVSRLIPAQKVAPSNWRAAVYRLLFSNQGMAIFLIISILSSLFIGAYSLGLKEVVQAIGDGVISNETTQTNAITYLIWHIRLPRIILALLVGAGLATSGAAIQGLFRNPLADPALIGITSGAMVFAVAGILFAGVLLQSLNGFLGYATITFLAFSGSFLSTIIVYRLATVEGHTSVSTLLLAGIAITALGGAITGLMTYYSSEDELRDITFWTLGSLGGANWKMLAFVCPLVIGSIFILLKNATRLDILLLGEKEARYLGVHTQKLKWIIVGCTAMAVGVCVAVSGVIAFVALVIPHLIRLCKGTGHYNLLTGSALLGGILLVWADNFARTAIAPAELPIGILTALLGAPFFIWLLLKSRQNFS